tara:strand:- start:2412 stop:3206 length:795 start_codon:yes stop_codon:yes gene_type:complete
MKGKTIIIFGGEGQLGKRLSLILKKQGSTVISVDKKYIKSNEVKRKSKNYYQANIDLKNENSVSNLQKIIQKKFKKIDGIVFSATIKTKDFYYPLKDLSYLSWKSIIDIELGGAFLVSKYFGNSMSLNKKGSIVFVSSIYGIVGNDHKIYKNTNLAKVYSNKSQNKNIFSNSAYAASKGGIISLVKFLATYWEGKNIRVNSVSPGGISNKMEDKRFVRNYSNKVPLQRKAKLEEVCSSIIFLLSNKSSYVNGHNLVVDGGFTAW